MRVFKDSPSCHGSCCNAECGQSSLTPAAEREFTIALAGQPNTGKSTLFNMLTGASQHVGNWPGKTVEKKEGFFEYDGTRCHIYDLPGTYSLTANSLEERIAREFILKEQPDVVLVVVDGAQLARSLYMVAEMMLLQCPMVVVLNKMDAAARRGITVNLHRFGEITGAAVVPVTAVSGRGKTRLINTALEAGRAPASPRPSHGLDLTAVFGPVFDDIRDRVSPFCPAGLPLDWVCLKLTEGDPQVREQIREAMPEDAWDSLDCLLSPLDRDSLSGVQARYRWIETLLDEATQGRKDQAALGTFDRLALHPVLGFVVAVLGLGLSILAAYIVAIPLMAPGFVLFFSAPKVSTWLAGTVPDWVASLTASGLMMGLSMGTIVTGFIGAVFFVLGLLENSGYLARLAYVFDPLMRRVGLHGKSVMPIIMGMICNIVGVAGSRTIDSWRQRMLTMAIVPVVPCKSLLVVAAFICGVFFGTKAPLVLVSLFVSMILVMVLTSRVLNRHIIPGERTGLIMELPPYHTPGLKAAWLYSFTRMKAFYRHGFWFLVLFGILSWAGLYFPHGHINTSYLAAFGRFIEPFGAIMGLDWRLCISFLVAFMSKEATLGAMAIIFGLSGAGHTDIGSIAIDKDLWVLVQTQFSNFLSTSGLTAANALGFVFAVFFSLPCFSTLGMIWAETRSLKWTLGILAYYFFLSVLMGSLAFHIGRLIL